MDISETTLILQNSTFQNIDNSNIRSDFSEIILNLIIFNEILCVQIEGGCIFTILSQSQLKINSTIIKNVQNIEMIGNIYLEDSQAEFSQLLMNVSRATKKSASCVYNKNSNFSLFDSIFVSYEQNCLVFSQGFVVISQTIFDNSENSFKSLSKDGAVLCNPCNNLRVESTVFKNNQMAAQGAGLKILNKENLEHNWFFIYNCTFEANIAMVSGGAVYISNIQGNITSCFFLDNQAKSGGGIYIFNTGTLVID